MSKIDRKKRKRKRRLYCVISIIALIFLVTLFQIIKTTSSNKDCTIKKNLLLVNKSISMGEGYFPDNLVIPSVPIAEEASSEEKQVDKSIVEPLKELMSEASSKGYDLYLLSGYRSYDTQKYLYESRAKENGQEYADLFVAKPGHSEHQSGLALDVTNDSRNFKDSKEADWLANNAYKFGFIIRYPKGKEDITGYIYEPWHIRYVGKEVAKEIYDKGITLEEYLQ